MKTYTSFQELDALGEGLAKKYTGNTHRWNSSCFDIGGFITDFLKLPILYEAFAEDDPSKIGFLSDGITPLIVYRAGKKTPVVFPKDTIVIERFLQRSDESGRRRFTLAHEAAHFILNRHWEVNGEALLETPDCHVEDDVLRSILTENMLDAMCHLSEIEQKVINHLYLSDDPMTEREFEKAFGVRRCTVHYYKGSALEKLREMLSENV